MTIEKNIQRQRRMHNNSPFTVPNKGQKFSALHISLGENPRTNFKFSSWEHSIVLVYACDNKAIGFQIRIFPFRIFLIQLYHIIFFFFSFFLLWEDISKHTRYEITKELERRKVFINLLAKSV